METRAEYVLSGIKRGREGVMGCFGGGEGVPEDTIGQCPECGADVDIDGISTGWYCCYSPLLCEVCKNQPCDQSCKEN